MNPVIALANASLITPRLTLVGTTRSIALSAGGFAHLGAKGAIDSVVNTPENKMFGVCDYEMIALETVHVTQGEQSVLSHTPVSTIVVDDIVPATTAIQVASIDS